MKKFGRRAAGMALALASLGLDVQPAAAYHTNFQGTCSSTPPTSVSTWRRTDSRTYAAVGNYEGYQYGGGCWDNDNKDDSPNDPTSKTDTRGEGGDCSGFTFKSWALSLTSGDYSYKWYTSMRNIHGPFSTGRYQNPASSDPFYKIERKSTVYMDASSGGGHIVMIYQVYTKEGTDIVVHAQDEANGTDIEEGTYRFKTGWVTIRRKNWSA
jgi:hypothetical protein